jgi:hypothetical protein
LIADALHFTSLAARVGFRVGWFIWRMPLGPIRGRRIRYYERADFWFGIIVGSLTVGWLLARWLSL